MNCYASEEYCKSNKLGKTMQRFRAERPSEWLMDEFIREVEKLSADAERYRWLRSTTNYATSKGERIDVKNNPELWDAAIDECIAETNKV